MREDGSHEIMSQAKAAKEAARQDADLLLVAASSSPPVVRIGHLDHVAFREREREKQIRRNAVKLRRTNALKEVHCGLPV